MYGIQSTDGLKSLMKRQISSGSTMDKQKPGASIISGTMARRARSAKSSYVKPPKAPRPKRPMRAAGTPPLKGIPKAPALPKLGGRAKQWGM